MILMRDVTTARRPEGKRLRGAQHAVDAVAHEDGIDGRLQVNVGGAHLHGIGDDLVDEADGGRLARHVTQALHVHFARLGAAIDLQPSIFGGRRDVERLICLVEICRHKEARADAHCSQVGKRAQRLVVEGIGDADDDGVLVGGKRHDTVAADKVGSDHLQEYRLRRHGGRCGQRNRQVLG
jgi:hypothetical protein